MFFNQSTFCFLIFTLVSSVFVQTSFAAKSIVVLECPYVMATTVSAEKHRGWSVYSNNPLRLTGADIAFISPNSNEDATLDPDEVKHLNDEDMTDVSVFRLVKHSEAKRPSLICHYGIHAQLSRSIPAHSTECLVIHHQSYGDIDKPEYLVQCK